MVFILFFENSFIAFLKMIRPWREFIFTCSLFICSVCFFLACGVFFIFDPFMSSEVFDSQLLFFQTYLELCGDQLHGTELLVTLETKIFWLKVKLNLLLLLKILVIVVPLLISVAYFTLVERKIMASIQRRKGPNVVGYLGLLQPLADGLKLFVKETVLPSSANSFLYYLAPLLTFVLSLIGWAVIPFGEDLVVSDLNIGVFYLLSVSALSVYGIVLAGWASNSKYAFLGALRSAAQMISYEVSIGFIILTVSVCAGSFNLSDIVLAQEEVWYVFPLLPLFFIFCVSALAETNRHPFDLPEAEAELVSGYNVEYSAMGFALFFLGEYANMLLMSTLIPILFLGGWAPLIPGFASWFPETFWLGLKICIFVIMFCVARAALPRFRYDQLMDLGWKTFLPFSIAYFIFILSFLLSFDAVV